MSLKIEPEVGQEWVPLDPVLAWEDEAVVIIAVENDSVWVVDVYTLQLYEWSIGTLQCLWKPVEASIVQSILDKYEV
jgi:hypothetical protein